MPSSMYAPPALMSPALIRYSPIHLFLKTPGIWIPLRSRSIYFSASWLSVLPCHPAQHQGIQRLSKIPDHRYGKYSIFAPVPPGRGLDGIVRTLMSLSLARVEISTSMRRSPIVPFAARCTARLIDGEKMDLDRARPRAPPVHERRATSKALAFPACGGRCVARALRPALEKKYGRFADRVRKISQLNVAVKALAEFVQSLAALLCFAPTR